MVRRVQQKFKKEGAEAAFQAINGKAQDLQIATFTPL